MTTFTEEQAKQGLEAVLDAAQSQGIARIKRGDGREFILRPAVPAGRSPLDVGSVNLGLTADEIVAAVREGRERPYRQHSE